MSRGDQDKYDRQLRLWGAHGQRALSTSRICVLGAGAVATEAMKNLVLPGCGSLCVVDGQRVRPRDVANNFFLTAECLGRPRSEAALELLTEMNPDVKLAGELGVAVGGVASSSSLAATGPGPGCVWSLCDPVELIRADAVGTAAADSPATSAVRSALARGGVDTDVVSGGVAGTGNGSGLKRKRKSSEFDGSESDGKEMAAPTSAAASVVGASSDVTPAASTYASSSFSSGVSGNVGGGRFFSQFSLVVVAGNEVPMHALALLSRLLWDCGGAGVRFRSCLLSYIASSGLTIIMPHHLDYTLTRLLTHNERRQAPSRPVVPKTETPGQATGLVFVASL